MKILHICNLPLPVDHPDYGCVRDHPGRWALNLAVAQKKHTDILPELLVQVPGASCDFDTETEGIPIHFVKAPDRLRAASLFFFDTRRLARYARDLTPDLVHAHGTEDAYGLAAQRSRLPNVITVQGISFYINRIIAPPLISRARVVEWTENVCLERARHVIAKSAYVADHLGSKFKHLAIHQIPNAIDPKLFEISVQKEQNVIAFVGSIIPIKGLDLLCQATEIARLEIPDLSLWIFGDHPARTSTYEQEMYTRFRSVLAERVIFHGTIPNLEVARRVAKANALVAPSREEMFGNQLIEALMVGTYGIVTEGTAMAENVRRFGGGTIVSQEDPKALAQAIVTAVADPPHVPTAAIRQRIREYMGPEIVARRHYALYRELLGKS